MRLPVLLAAAALLAFTACASLPPDDDSRPRPPETYVPLAKMAERLGLSVSLANSTRVTLDGPGNTVSLFPHPAPYAYVNGKPVGPHQGMLRLAGAWHVPASLEEVIRRAMKPAAASLPPPPPPPPGPPPPPAPPPRPLAPFRIVVDAGHGGRDPGTRSAAGAPEKAVNLGIARRLADLLRQRGAEVTMTRSGDTFVDLEERAAIANRFGAHLFLSIHADAAKDTSARGFTVYVSRSAAGETLRMAEALVAALSGQDIPSRGVRRADYRVLVKTRMPAVLVETGYMSNSTEAALLVSDAAQQRIARSLAKGIEAALTGR